jgi:hypothetical protein
MGSQGARESDRFTDELELLALLDLNFEYFNKHSEVH